MSDAKERQSEQVKAIEQLRKMLKPGDTVYTILRHVSRSGMMRSISTVIISEGKPYEIDYLVSKAINHKIDEANWGIKIQGCGMDMGFHLVYSLGWVLWPKGFKTWAGYWRNEPLDFEPDGGYALTQKWL